MTFNTTYSTKNFIYLRGSNSNWINGSSITITQEMLNDRIAFYGTNNAVISNIMIEKGSTATAYEPYGKVWYLEKQIGKVVLDSSLSSVASTNFSNVYQIYANVMNISYLIGGFCDNFKFNDDSRITDNTNANIWLSNNQCALRLGNESARDRFYVKSTNFASANELKAYFNTNPTELYYVLATPTYTEITNTELIEDLESIELLKGENNITITSENLPALLQLSYYKQTLQGNVEYLDETKANKEDIPSLDNYYTKQEVNNLIPDELSDLRDDSTHRLVSDSEKSTWNNKIDSSALTDYVKNTDYASSNKGGVFKTDSNNYALSVNPSNGILYVNAKTYSEYSSANNNLAIGKGTLENVITGKGLINNSVNNLTNYTKTSDLSSVATSGSYNDLSNKPTIPTIPTNVSTFTNDAGYITNSVNNLTNYTTTTDMNTALGNKQNAVLSGTTAPTSSLGEDGDIYLQYS